MVLSLSMPAQIKGNPTMIWGWYDQEEMQAWSRIFPVTLESLKQGFLPLTDPAWMEWDNPCWIFPSDKPTKAELKIFSWRALSPQSLEQSLKELGLEEKVEVRNIWMPKTGVMRCWGNEVSITVVWTTPNPLNFNLLVSSSEQTLGIIKHVMTIMEGAEAPRKQLRELGWSLVSKMKAHPPSETGPFLSPFSPMNIIFWNYRGALNHRFHLVLTDLINKHSLSIVIITETRVGGERAKDITDRLPFDGAIHSDTIGYSRGSWLLWKSDTVEISQLAKTEQEIHVVVKVHNSNLSWLLSYIYASPRLEERKLLWNNLVSISNLHRLPWLMVGDFNELLSCHDKLGGNSLNSRRVQLFKDCLDSCGMLDLGFNGPRFTWVNKREAG